MDKISDFLISALENLSRQGKILASAMSAPDIQINLVKKKMLSFMETLKSMEHRLLSEINEDPNSQMLLKEVSEAVRREIVTFSKQYDRMPSTGKQILHEFK